MNRFASLVRLIGGRSQEIGECHFEGVVAHNFFMATPIASPIR